MTSTKPYIPPRLKYKAAVSAHHALLVRFTVIAAVVSMLSYRGRASFLDDALIYARYVRNALDGHGFVFNVGEQVNALTSPLYSYLVLVVAWLVRGHVLAASVIVSAVALCAACCLAEILIPFAGLLIASTKFLYGLVGMETSLFLCLLLLLLLSYQRGFYQWCPTVATLLLLTRFEGGALLVPLLLGFTLRRRWPSWRSCLPALLILALYLALNHYLYGGFLPVSASAKFGQGRSGLWGRWPFAFFDTAYQLKPEFLPTWYVVAGVLALLVPGIRRLWRSSLLRLGLPFLFMLLSFYLLFNIPGYMWYYAPFICFAMLYACAGLPSMGAWRWTVVPVLLFSGISAQRHLLPLLPLPSASVKVDYPGIAAWLQANARTNARVEAAEIGTLGWICSRCSSQDILGLTSPKNADHVAHRDFRSWLREDHPEYILMHYKHWSFEDVARDDADFERLPVDFGDAVYLLRRKH